MKGLIIIDRIENGIAACELESREIRMIALSDLPHGVAEGDCLRHDDGKYIIDAEETCRRRRVNAELLKKLLGR